MELKNFYQSFFYKFSIFSGIINIFIAIIFLYFAFVIPPTPASGVLGGIVSTVFVLPALAITVIGSLIILLVTVLKKKQYTYTKPTKKQILPISLYMFFMFALLYWITSATKLGIWFFAIGIPCAIPLLYSLNVIINIYAQKPLEQLSTMKSFPDTFTCKLVCLAAIIPIVFKLFAFIELPFVAIQIMDFIYTILTVVILVVYLYERKHNAPLTQKPEILNLKNIAIYALVAYKTIYTPAHLFWAYIKLFMEKINIVIHPSTLITFTIFLIFINLFYKQIKK